MPIYSAWAKKNGSNIYTAGSQDMAAAAALIVPSSAGFAPTAAGSHGYDTTQKNFVGGAGGISGKFPRVIFADNDVATAGNSLDAGTIGTTETIFASKYTVPANFLLANKALRVSFILEQISPGTAVSAKYNLRWGGIGGTLIMQGLAGTPGVNRTNTVASMILIHSTAAPGASVNIHTAQGPTGGVTGWPLNSALSQPIPVATNAANDIVLTITYGGSTAGNINKLHAFIVEELN